MQFDPWLLFPVGALFIFFYVRYRKMLKEWNIRWSKDVPTKPIEINGEYFFEFPNTPNGHVNYFQWFRRIFPWLKSPSKLKGAKFIAATFTITGDGFLPVEFPDREATCTLIIQRKGDNGSGVGKYQSYRWYSRENLPLKAGTYTFRVGLNVDEWGDINNQRDPGAFKGAIENFESIGIVFGSKGGRGHGVRTTSNATFTLHSMKVE